MSKSEVRELFNEWRSSSDMQMLSHECRSKRGDYGMSDDVRLIGPGIECMPRFQYCLYVDQKCLDNFKDVEEARAKITDPDELCRFQLDESVAIVIIDASFSEPPLKMKQRKKKRDSLRRFPAVEGCELEYVGWQYQNVQYLLAKYSALHGRSLEEAYTRPPGVGPDSGTMERYE